MNDFSNGQIVAGKYRIDKFWYADATSQTYFATQVLIDKPIVFKTLNSSVSSEVIEQFQVQARTLSRINNQHVLNVLDYGTDDRGLPFLVLENAEGLILRELIADENNLSLERATSIASQICDALAAAQASNTVHGNLSSDKILVSRRNDNEFVKVLDFGMMKLAAVDNEKTVVRADLPYYKAPEQLINESIPDFRADIYALGVILFEMLTGKRPFTGDNPATIAQKHTGEIPPSLLAARPDLPPVFEQIVQRALAKQPNQRFQSVQDFAAALNQAVSNANEQRSIFDSEQFAFASDQSGARATETIDENNRWKTAFIVLAGISLLSLVTIFLTSGKRTDPSTELSSDPNAQVVQPINPVANMDEEFNNINALPNGNSNVDPSVVPPGVTGVPQGIPPGLYPSGTVTIPGDSNSIFMQDLDANVNLPANVNASRSANVATNTNVRPGANANTATANSQQQQRPNNTNANSGAPANSNNNQATPAPTATPAQTPRARPTPPTSSNSSNKSGAANSGVKTPPSQP